MKAKRYETDYAGKKVIIEHGKLSTQASAAVTAQMGETLILAAVTMSDSARESINFFPLMVDLEERYYAAGEIKGPRYTKRPGRPSDDAILISRMIDRGIRPLFPQDMRNEVQVICLPLSLDQENKPDVVAMIAACTALHISKIPFDGPITGVRVAMVNGDYIINPTVEELEFSDLNMMVMGDGERINMVDCDAQELTDVDVAKAFQKAMEAMGPMAKFIDGIRKDIGIPKVPDDKLVMKVRYDKAEEKLIKDIKKAAVPHLDKYLFNIPKGSKRERKEALKDLKEKLVDQFWKKAPDIKEEEEARNYMDKLLGSFWYEFIEEQVSLAILKNEKRVDGRKIDEIRPLDAEVSVLPRTHGSGLFTRGETQILSTVTLGGPYDELYIETMETEGSEKYFHHYNFLPYCVGDIKMLRGAGRREIGHGALAEKALRPVLPEVEDFPYTMRVVSEVISSNGSSSMGATCGSTLSLMDAGVPIERAVAGIAMGLASDGKKWKVITDLQDLEDGAGGMDFKFTSTRKGLTAIQMDTKTRGLSMDIIKATFPQMRKAINQILDTMEKAIDKPREELSEYAPRIIHLMIDPEKIGNVIGPGGKMIRSITEEYDLEVDINDEGVVLITSKDAENAKKAEEVIKSIVKEVEVGDVFEEAEVVKIMPFGAFVNLTPGTDGMLHISEIDWGHTNKVTDAVNLGDTVKVKVIKVDRGKIDVSRKALLPKPEGYKENSRPRGRSRGGYKKGGRRGSRRKSDHKKDKKD